jgi:hypothetical protein
MYTLSTLALVLADVSTYGTFHCCDLCCASSTVTCRLSSKSALWVSIRGSVVIRRVEVHDEEIMEGVFHDLFILFFFYREQILRVKNVNNDKNDDSIPFLLVGNKAEKVVKSKIQLVLPFMVPELVHKFQMLYLTGT